jgi:hypothetical protein
LCENNNKTKFLTNSFKYSLFLRHINTLKGFVATFCFTVEDLNMFPSVHYFIILTPSDHLLRQIRIAKSIRKCNLAYSNKSNIKIVCKIKKSESYVQLDSKFKYVLNLILIWNALLCITCYRTTWEMLFFFVSNYIETMVLRLHFYNDLFKTESLYEFWIRSAAGYSTWFIDI